MKFSSRVEYGLRAMADLAACFPAVRTVREISSENEIPPKYLERLIGILRKKHLVMSYKGKVGGYSLAKNPQRIKVGEIVEALDGPIEPMGCESSGCSISGCRPKRIWTNLGKIMRKNLYSIRLSDLNK